MGFGELIVSGSLKWELGCVGKGGKEAEQGVRLFSVIEANNGIILVISDVI